MEGWPSVDCPIRSYSTLMMDSHMSLRSASMCPIAKFSPWALPPILPNYATALITKHSTSTPEATRHTRAFSPTTLDPISNGWKWMKLANTTVLVLLMGTSTRFTTVLLAVLLAVSPITAPNVQMAISSRGPTVSQSQRSA